MRVFKSKIDTWLLVVLGLIPASSLALLVAGVVDGAGSEIVSGVIALAATAAFFRGLVLPMRYELDDDGLVVRFGLLKWRVAYKDIRGVEPTRNAVSSPALSMDRLRIDSGESAGTNISPADKRGFLQALAERAPHLVLEGDRLVPRAD